MDTAIDPKSFDRDLLKNTNGEIPPATQPVPNSRDLEALGAERLGSEEFDLNEEVESKNRDIKQLLKGFIKSITGGNTEKREGPKGQIWRQIENSKMKKGVSSQGNQGDEEEIE